LAVRAWPANEPDFSKRMRTKHAEREAMLGAPSARFRLGGIARYLPGHRPRDQV